MRTRVLAAAAALLAAWAAPARAAVLSYADLASWSEAVGASSFVDLGAVLGADVVQPRPAGFTASGVTFLDPGGQYLVLVSPYDAPATSFPGPSVVGCNLCGGGLGIDLLLPASTFAVSFRTRAWFGGDVSVTLDDGLSFLIDPLAGETAFFGLTSEQPLRRLQIDGAPGDFPMVGDIRYAGGSGPPAEPIPEPASLLLLAAGLAGLAARRVA